MIKILTKAKCSFCKALIMALDKLDAKYQLVYDHDELIVPQGFDEEENLLFMGLPEFNDLINILENGQKNKN